ncbi:non-heme iron oxygenase ferredoxin subunit [Euzebya tangerina]|uniref:non-heme iron oxygenase ferredoxin subunit n=1 Tax=Euzebya tangerina TaxID=591198 RepID=UPI00196B0B6F|nr:non-heme iron oxygenase ferredoxin subunit [Euzebya tangerina]
MERTSDTHHRVEGGAGMAPGDVRLLEVGVHRICLARTEAGEVFAVDDTCTHEDEPLSEGWVEGDCIECPAHNSTFDLRTGEALMLPAVDPVRTYPVTVDGDDLVVELPGA